MVSAGAHLELRAMRSRASSSAPRATPDRRDGSQGLAAAVVGALGGRHSTQLGIDIDRGEEEIERWALAATLFGARISAPIAARTFAVLEGAGVHSIAQAGLLDVGRMIELLDRGGYARYDLRTAEHLRSGSQMLSDRHRGRVGSILELPAGRLESELDELPGWGPVTVSLFLRELRGLRPQIDPPLDPRAASACEHLQLLGAGATPARLRRLAAIACIDARDLESALLRLWLAHHRQMSQCPGGVDCTAIATHARAR